MMTPSHTRAKHAKRPSQDRYSAISGSGAEYRGPGLYMSLRDGQVVWVGQQVQLVKRRARVENDVASKA